MFAIENEPMYTIDFRWAKDMIRYDILYSLQGFVLTILVYAMLRVMLNYSHKTAIKRSLLVGACATVYMLSFADVTRT